MQIHMCWVVRSHATKLQSANVVMVRFVNRKRAGVLMAQELDQSWTRPGQALDEMRRSANHRGGLLLSIARESARVLIDHEAREIGGGFFGDVSAGAADQKKSGSARKLMMMNRG